MDVDRYVAPAGDAAGPGTSADLQAFLFAWEACRLTPYLDVAGKCTVGVGHLLLADEPREPITLARAIQLFDADIGRIAAGVAACVTIPLDPHQFDALCSFAFNEGVQALRDSTLLRLVNLGQFVAAGFEFPKWNKAHVDNVLQVVDGLTRRRAAERAMFERADYSGRP